MNLPPTSPRNVPLSAPMPSMLSWLCLLLFAFLLGVSSSLAQPISYTVQVAALGDEEAARQLRRELAGAGYPSYLVRVPTDSGPIYRLRVGAFANRAAAASYAALMPNVAGSSPVPALAEGIPSGVIPVETELLESFPNAATSPTTSLEVIPWQDHVALRAQTHDDEGFAQARYWVLEPGLAHAPLEAWRAAPGQNGWVLRVYSFPLGSAGRANEETLEALATTLPVSAERLEGYLFDVAGTPTLLLAERFDPRTGERERLAALGVPDGALPRAGPRLDWLGTTPPARFPATLPEALWRNRVQPDETATVFAGHDVAGDGWTASPDDGFTRLTVAEQSWRAAAGVPVWAHGNYLLVVLEDEMALYALGPAR